jgi:hypothetical protein
MGCRTSKDLVPLGRRETSKIQWFYDMKEHRFYSQHETQPIPPIPPLTRDDTSEE